MVKKFIFLNLICSVGLLAMVKQTRIDLPEYELLVFHNNTNQSATIEFSGKYRRGLSRTEVSLHPLIVLFKGPIQGFDTYTLEPNTTGYLRWHYDRNETIKINGIDITQTLGDKIIEGTREKLPEDMEYTVQVVIAKQITITVQRSKKEATPISAEEELGEPFGFIEHQKSPLQLKR